MGFLKRIQRRKKEREGDDDGGVGDGGDGGDESFIHACKRAFWCFLYHVLKPFIVVSLLLLSLTHSLLPFLMKMALGFFN